MKLLRFVLFFSCCLSPYHLYAKHWFPVKLEDSQIILPLTIFGEEVDAIVDTGANIHGIANSFINKYEDRLSFQSNAKISGVYKTKQQRVVNTIPFQINQAKLKLKTVFGLDIKDNTALIGIGLMQKSITQIDYANARLRFLPSGAVDMKKFANVDMKVHGRGNSPTIKVQINNKKTLWLVMDTGYSGGVLLTRRRAKTLGLLDKEAVSGKSTGVNASSDVSEVTVDSLIVGPFELEQVPVLFPASSHNTNIADEGRHFSMYRTKRKAFDGLIGYDILRHFLITMDYENERIHFAQGKKMVQ